MKVLIDTNVALTYVSGREDAFSSEIDKIFELISDGEIEACLAFHSLSTIAYVTRKLDDEVRRDWLRQMCELLTICGSDNRTILNALDNKEFKDLEDILQDCCALSADADYVITANMKDFKGVSQIPGLTPAEFLERFPTCHL